MNPSIKFLISCIFSAALLISCGKKDAPATEKSMEEHAHEERNTTVELTQDQYTMAGITLGAVEIKNLSSVIQVNGVLDAPPQNVVSISPRIGGYVRSTPLLQGLHVRKGQTLAVLEHQDVATLQQEFLETRSRLEFAEMEFKRQETLQTENISALKTFQQTAADYEILKSRSAALKQRLALISVNADKLRTNDVSAAYTITSTIDGYVGAVNITMGQFVSPNDVLCRIINTSHVHAELTVFERDAPKLHEGQRVRLRLVNETAERTAKIYLIGHEITKERTLRVHAHLDKEDGKLLPNTALTALVELGEQSLPAVPDAAVVSADGKNYIFAFIEHNSAEHKKSEPQQQESRNKRFVFQMVEVKRGAAAGGFTEVLLPEGFNRTATKIVTKGAYSLLSQMKSGAGGDEQGH